MDISSPYTRVLRTYVDAVVAPRLVSFKRILLSSTGWMTSMLNQTNQAMQQSKSFANDSQNSAQASHNSANDSQNSAQASHNSANDSQNSANNSQSSAVNAANTWSAMQAWITSFNTRWLGVLDNDPDHDNNGNPLTEGVEYYNKSSGHVRVWHNGQWHDQDESVEQEMNATAISAANAAGSANAAKGFSDESQTWSNRAQDWSNQSQSWNAQSQGANNAAQAALNSVNQSMYWMNTWWLGPSAGAPVQDRNSQSLRPGATYYDTNQSRLVTWNGGGWFTVVTADDLNRVQQDLNNNLNQSQQDLNNRINQLNQNSNDGLNQIRQNFVNVDGSNQMTGPLVLDLYKTNGPAGDWTQGVTIRGNDTYQDRWVSTPGFVAQIDQSSIRTFYATCNDSQLRLSYGRIRHCDGAGGWKDFKFRSDGAFIAAGDIWAGDDGKGNVRGYGVWMDGADLAECYKTLIDIPRGTIVSISTSDDPDQELDLAMHREDVFGVISTAPGAVLNSQIEKGVPVGMVGRVPVRILGPVKKGQKIYLSNKAGIGTADISRAVSGSLLGFSLETSNDVFEHLTEVALKF